MVFGGLIVVTALLTAFVVVVTHRPREEAADAGARLLSGGNYRAAIPLLVRAVTIRADDAWAHYHLGLAYTLVGWRRAAINQFSAAVRLAPQSAEFREGLGCAYRDAGNTAAAVKELEEAVRLTPEEVRYHVRLAGLLLELGRRTDAIPHLRRAARLRPAFPAIRQFLAQALAGPAALPGAAGQYPALWRVAADTALGELARQENHADQCPRPGPPS